MNRGRVTDIRSTVSRESRARPPVSRLNTGRRLEKRPRGLWTGSLPLSLVSRTGQTDYSPSPVTAIQGG